VSCVGVGNSSSLAELRRYLVRFGIIRAAHVVLPCQELLRQILMSSATVTLPVSHCDSSTDIAADASIDSSLATDAMQVQLFPSLGHFSTLFELVFQCLNTFGRASALAFQRGKYV